MLTSFSVENFKAFGEGQMVPLKPITLVFGANSSGKSSLIHSLLLANEGLQSGTFSPAFTRLGGESVDLGGFNRYVHNHDPNQRVAFTFDAALEPNERFYSLPYAYHQRSNRMRASPKTLRFTVEVGRPRSNPTRLEPEPRVLSYAVEADGHPLFTLTNREVKNHWWARHERLNLRGRKEEATEILRSQEIFFNYLYLGELNANHEVFTDLFSDILSRYEITDQQRPLFFERVLRIFAQLSVFPITLEARGHSYLEVIEEPIFVTTAAPLISERCSAFIRDLTEIEGGLEQFEEIFESMLDSARSEAGSEYGDEPSGDNAKGGLAQVYAAYWEELRDDAFQNEVWEALELSSRISHDCYEHVDELLTSTDRVLMANIGKFAYLGPLRSYPDRIIKEGHTLDPNWHANGGYAWQAVQEDADIRKRVNEWLGSDFLRTGYRLEQRKLFAPEDIQLAFNSAMSSDPTLTFDAILEHSAPTATELSLVDLRTGTRVSHRDIGVGISQILPVLVSAYGSKQKLIMVEQPEIHLHPALQAELGDVFIKSALGESSNQFFLETHSEHLILRLMRRIRETSEGTLPEGLPAVRPDDVAILFLEATSHGSVVRQINLDEDGQLVDAWPGGFFEESFRERFA
jgi:hypothetical protein